MENDGKYVSSSRSDDKHFFLTLRDSEDLFGKKKLKRHYL